MCNILDRVDIELAELNSNLDKDGTSVPDIHNMSLEDSFDCTPLNYAAQIVDFGFPKVQQCKFWQEMFIPTVVFSKFQQITSDFVVGSK
jgi:hypothetical protein